MKLLHKVNVLHCHDYSVLEVLDVLGSSYVTNP